jgi:hypothetical protein
MGAVDSTRLTRLYQRFFYFDTAMSVTGFDWLPLDTFRRYFYQPTPKWVTMRYIVLSTDVDCRFAAERQSKLQECKKRK